MSRMRLMQDVTGASALECLYCGARAESAAPVVYCDCRYAREAGPAASARKTRPLARTA